MQSTNGTPEILVPISTKNVKTFGLELGTSMAKGDSNTKGFSMAPE